MRTPRPPEYNVEERPSQQTYVNAQPVPFFAQLNASLKLYFNFVEERPSQQTFVNAQPVPFFAQLKCIPEIILQLWMWGEGVNFI